MNRFDDEEAEFDLEPEDGEMASSEACAWQWLLRLNPGDQELAMQQFAVLREQITGQDTEGQALILPLTRVIDWQSGFQVDAADTRSLVQVIDELTARWNLSVDWEGDTEDDDFHADSDVPSLLAIAYDSLAPYGYTLWVWEAEPDSYAGGISLSRDSEAMRELAALLGIELRLASEAG